MMPRLSALSSTTRIRRAVISGEMVRKLGEPAATPQTSVHQKVEPCPGELVTPIWPRINSTSCLQMARPSPVPPYWRVVEASTCEKD